MSVASTCNWPANPDPRRVLAVIQKHLKPGVLVFVGVTDPINPEIENSEQVLDRILEAAEFRTCREAEFHNLPLACQKVCCNFA